MSQTFIQDCNAFQIIPGFKTVSDLNREMKHEHGSVLTLQWVWPSCEFAGKPSHLSMLSGLCCTRLYNPKSYSPACWEGCSVVLVQCLSQWVCASCLVSLIANTKQTANSNKQAGCSSGERKRGTLSLSCSPEIFILAHQPSPWINLITAEPELYQM